MKNIFNIPEFARYVNIHGLKNDTLHICKYNEESKLRNQSPPVGIDFYFLSIKSTKDIIIENPVKGEFTSDSYLYLDCPYNTMEWDLTPPVSGYSIMVSADYLSNHVKDYNFMHYNNHEALFLTREEEVLLWDLFDKAYHEFSKEDFQRNILISYIVLILTYTQHFYNRQFDSRSRIYHKVVNSFQKELETYFNNREGISGLPSVAYFAQKANLSANYFGDLIKHFTGKSPLDHIHYYITERAKQMLKTSEMTVNEISYQLGFDYPTYFTRFFRKRTGMAPKIFREL
ncbi:TPA: helix-turn-helix domain-containing protein [Elizabethkingia anophelis]